jgi:hypothetical protein
MSLLFVLGGPLWREAGSVICSAICQWSESRRTHNHTLMFHLRLLGSLSCASYDSHGLRWKYLTGLHTGIAEILPYTACHSYWKMCHWQSEHECDTCMTLLRHTIAVLCEIFSVTPILTVGQVEEDLLHGLHVHQISTICILFREILPYAAIFLTDNLLPCGIVCSCGSSATFGSNAAYFRRWRWK